MKTENRGIGTQKQEGWKRKKGHGESAKGGVDLCTNCAGRERKREGKRRALSTCTLENLRRICSYLLASDGERRTNTFIPFKKTRDRADSSALMKSCSLPLPARRIYGRMRPWGFGASPLRDFRRRVSSLSLPLFFSLIPFTVFVFLGLHPFSLFIPVKKLVVFPSSPPSLSPSPYLLFF